MGFHGFRRYSRKRSFSHSYTDSWWFTKCMFLLMRIQNFTYQHGPPTYEEYISNRRLKEWESIYKDLCEYGKALPQSLSPYAIIDRGSLDGHDIAGLYRQSTYRSSETSKIKEVHISSDLGVLVNVLYHCSVIWALHIKPCMTSVQKWKYHLVPLSMLLWYWVFSVHTKIKQVGLLRIGVTAFPLAA